MLGELADDIGKVLGRFEPSSSGLTLRSADAAEFHRLSLEAKALLSHELGLNEYSSALAAAAVRDLSFLGTSYSTVEHVQATILAAKNKCPSEGIVGSCQVARTISARPLCLGGTVGGTSINLITGLGSHSTRAAV